MKIALITGGSRGIGAEVVKKFAKGEYTVILNYNRSKAEAEALREQLLNEGADIHLYKADVSDSAQVEEMFAWIKKFFKHVDVLVNNAGMALSAPIQDVSEGAYDAIMNTNAKGTFLCCQKAVEMFLQSGGGSIVNMSSIWGLLGASCESVYSMSKHAIVGLTKSLAAELAPSHIIVNCVCPPIVLTDMSRNLSEEDKRAFCAEHGVSLYTPQQVAQDVYRLATGQQTGQILQER